MAGDHLLPLVAEVPGMLYSQPPALKTLWALEKQGKASREGDRRYCVLLALLGSHKS